MREILVGVVTAVLGAILVARLDLDKPAPVGATSSPAWPPQVQPLLDECLRLLAP
jgi:hypothetical protein